jgi:hypothetical protein
MSNPGMPGKREQQTSVAASVPMAGTAVSTGWLSWYWHADSARRRAWRDELRRGRPVTAEGEPPPVPFPVPEALPWLLVDYLAGEIDAWPLPLSTHPNEPVAWRDATLTDEQRQVIAAALSCPDVFSLRSTPGAGVYRTVAELVHQLNLRGRRVLVAAQQPGPLDAVFESLASAPSTYAVRVDASGQTTPDRPHDLAERAKALRAWAKRCDDQDRHQAVSLRDLRREIRTELERWRERSAAFREEQTKQQKWADERLRLPSQVEEDVVTESPTGALAEFLGQWQAERARHAETCQNLESQRSSAEARRAMAQQDLDKWLMQLHEQETGAPSVESSGWLMSWVHGWFDRRKAERLEETRCRVAECRKALEDTDQLVQDIQAQLSREFVRHQEARATILKTEVANRSERLDALVKQSVAHANDMLRDWHALAERARPVVTLAPAPWPLSVAEALATLATHPEEPNSAAEKPSDRPSPPLDWQAAALTLTNCLGFIGKLNGPINALRMAGAFDDLVLLQADQVSRAGWLNLGTVAERYYLVARSGRTEGPVLPMELSPPRTPQKCQVVWEESEHAWRCRMAGVSADAPRQVEALVDDPTIELGLRPDSPDLLEVSFRKSNHSLETAMRFVQNDVGTNWLWGTSAGAYWHETPTHWHLQLSPQLATEEPTRVEPAPGTTWYMRPLAIPTGGGRRHEPVAVELAKSVYPTAEDAHGWAATHLAEPHPGRSGRLLHGQGYQHGTMPAPPDAMSMASQALGSHRPRMVRIALPEVSVDARHAAMVAPVRNGSARSGHSRHPSDHSLDAVATMCWHAISAILRRHSPYAGDHPIKVGLLATPHALADAIAAASAAMPLGGWTLHPIFSGRDDEVFDDVVIAVTASLADWDELLEQGRLRSRQRCLVLAPPSVLQAAPASATMDDLEADAVASPAEVMLPVAASVPA